MCIRDRRKAIPAAILIAITQRLDAISFTFASLPSVWLSLIHISPYGYVLDETPVYFDVTEDNSTEESGVTVVKVDKPNMAQKGTITVEKPARCSSAFPSSAA